MKTGHDDGPAELRLDDALEFRLPDGARLVLIEIEQQPRTPRQRAGG